MLDLRGNTGGLLEQTIALAEWLLPPGTPIATLEARQPEDHQSWASRGRGPSALPLVVLLDAQTGSGAEIVAAAVQAARRGVLLGERSFGAGGIQTVMPLRGGGALRLTTAMVRLADGRLLQGHGVPPDIAVQPRPGPAPQRAADNPLEWRNPEPAPRLPAPWQELAALHAQVPLPLPGGAAQPSPDDLAADPLLQQALAILRLLPPP